VDVYYKRFDDLLVGRLETDVERAARLARLDVPAWLAAGLPTGSLVTTNPSNDATGRAHGLEARVMRTGGRRLGGLTGWASYSFGRADRTAYGVTRPFDYDRRHALSASGSLRIGPRVDVGATARWATGLPRTPVRGVRVVVAPDVADTDGDGNRDEDVVQADASGQPLFQPDLGGVAAINSARLPAYARLDARVSYRPRWSGERWALYVDLINLLNRTNATQIDSVLELDPMGVRPRVVEVPQEGGVPFFPSAGIRFWF
jgi:hypothetical protein